LHSSSYCPHNLSAFVFYFGYKDTTIIREKEEKVENSSAALKNLLEISSVALKNFPLFLNSISNFNPLDELK